jgi:hypothetical protein
MIKKGDKIVQGTLFVGQKVKGFQFDKDNSARVGWVEGMLQFIGVEGIVHKIAEGPHGVGSRIEIRFPRHWDGDYSNQSNTSWSHTIAVMYRPQTFDTVVYPLAECLQILREEKLKEIGI